MQFSIISQFAAEKYNYQSFLFVSLSLLTVTNKIVSLHDRFLTTIFLIFASGFSEERPARWPNSPVTPQGSAWEKNKTFAPRFEQLFNCLWHDGPWAPLSSPPPFFSFFSELRAFFPPPSPSVIKNVFSSALRLQSLALCFGDFLKQHFRSQLELQNINKRLEEAQMHTASASSVALWRVLS